MGTARRGEIRDYLDQAEDYPGCLTFVRDRKPRLMRLLENARSRFPHLVEELEGMAEAIDVPFMNLFAYNCRSEIAVLSQNAGCSTLGICEGGIGGRGLDEGEHREGNRMILAHNEDGADTNVGRMYLVKAKPPSGIEFIAFAYPGLLPGNGPGFNSRGVVQTTNYIHPQEVADGVPRYFIGRAVLEAKSLDEAVALASSPGRAFPWHHNLASLSEGKLLSLEAFPGKHSILEVKGVYVHTNHLIHPEMRGDEGSLDVPGESSLTRLRVLSRRIEDEGAPSTREELVRLLSLHEGQPHSPYRHPDAIERGATLGTAIFEAPDLAMTLYHGNPCQGSKQRHSL